MFETGDLVRGRDDSVVYLVLDRVASIYYNVLVVRSIENWFPVGDIMVLALPHDKWQKVEGTV